MVKRYILTGTPGSGKTSIINILKNQHYSIIDESATDIIAQEQNKGHNRPWEQENFIDKIIHLQKQRQIEADTIVPLQFYDRSPFCTYALARYLHIEPSETLLDEIERILKNKIYENKVFFIENLGFCTPTDARQISFEESLIFEQTHTEIYTQFGCECIKIPVLPLQKRVNLLLSLI